MESGLQTSPSKARLRVGWPGRPVEAGAKRIARETGNGDPGRIRTCGPQIRNLMLYPTELRGRIVQASQFCGAPKPLIWAIG
jgi:hypothetical protein